MILFLLSGLRTLAAEEVPEELYLEQAGSRTCTLCSATMMLRSCFYIMGNDLWQQVTENGVAAWAWTSDGLYWNWNYEIEDNFVKVAQQGCNGISEDKLKQVLDAHPEGIVLYCGGSAPHAVFLTDYDDGVFYCADPAMGYAGKRMPLDESLLGDRHGGQASILRAVSAYWYISSFNMENERYLSQCVEYPADYRIRVRWDGYAMSLPSGNEQGQSRKVQRVYCGDYFDASAFLVNESGESWYRVGERMYISASDARWVMQEERSISHNPQGQENQDVELLLLNPEIPPKNTK